MKRRNTVAGMRRFVQADKDYCLLFLMFVIKSLCGLVAYFSRTEVLYRSGIHVTGLHGPLVALRCEFFERGTIQIHKCFLNDRFHGTVTAFHVHHHGDWNAAGKP